MKTSAVDDLLVEPHPLDVTNLNRADALKFLLELGYPVTGRQIKDAFDRREVHPVRLGTGNYVSRRDMLNWIESRRQTGGPYRVPRTVAAETDR